jgi:hypothetical protein
MYKQTTNIYRHTQLYKTLHKSTTLRTHIQHSTKTIQKYTTLQHLFTNSTTLFFYKFTQLYRTKNNNTTLHTNNYTKPYNTLQNDTKHTNIPTYTQLYKTLQKLHNTLQTCTQL